MKTLVLGSRGSALALAQVELARRALAGAWPGIETPLEVIVTGGDRGAKPDLKGGWKGLFVKEIEARLLAGGIGAAVHSLKDMPGQETPGLRIGAVLERAPAGDVLVAKPGFDALGRPRIGTTSARRMRQAAREWPGCEIVPLRGNVPTRLARLAGEGALDAIILAEAGLARLGADPAVEGLEIRRLAWLGAAGQGIVALQCRGDDADACEILSGADHAATRVCAEAERALLALMDGDCRLALAARATLNGGALALAAEWFVEGEADARRGDAFGSPEEIEGIAREVFAQLGRGG